MGSTVSGLVSGGFDKIGYIPIATAVGQCEGQARLRLVEKTDNIICDVLMTRPLA